MDVRRFITSILITALISLPAASGELVSCLDSAPFNGHRIEKEETIRFCFNKYKAELTKDSCYHLLKQKVIKLSSIKLSEEIISICFYDTPQAQDINHCLNETKKFKNSSDHDEAVFYCYEQFQEKLSIKDCLKSAGQMIYPAKKEYLQQHCRDYIN